MTLPTQDAEPKPSVTLGIAAFLAARIRSGDLAPGQRLPTEQELSRQFEVGRPAVREAISRVKADGLVQSRQGSGLYVADLRHRRSFRVESFPPESLDIALRLFELRSPIETAAARLAAARCTDEDLASMEAAHLAFAGADPQSEDEVAADLRFHHAIAIATRNAYYVDLMTYLGGVLQDAMRFVRGRSGPDVHRLAIEEHGRIIRAIRHRNPDVAALAVLNHIDNARERMATGEDAVRAEDL